MINKADMAKKILVINDSPRNEGNTELLADSFIKGVRMSGIYSDQAWCSLDWRTSCT